MNKVINNKAWWLVLPVFLLVAFSAILPMMTVVNYSVQDIFDASTRTFVGVEWYQQVLQNERLHDSLLRQFIFSACVLLIEIPLGIAIALCMPTKGRWASENANCGATSTAFATEAEICSGSACRSRMSRSSLAPWPWKKTTITPGRRMSNLAGIWRSTRWSL